MYPWSQYSLLSISRRCNVVIIAILFSTIWIRLANCQHSCYVGEIISDADGKINSSSIRSSLKVQQCAPTITTHSPPVISSPTPVATTVLKSHTPTTESHNGTVSTTPGQTINSTSTTPHGSTVSPYLNKSTPATNVPTTPATNVPTTRATTAMPTTANVFTTANMTKTSPPSTTAVTNSSSTTQPPTAVPYNNSTACNATDGNCTVPNATTPSNSPATSTPTSATSNKVPSTQSASTPPGRKRREDMAEVAEPMCQVKVTLTGKPKVNAGTAWKVTFSCRHNTESCSNATGIDDDWFQNKTYCCARNNCNTFSYLQKRHQVQLSTIDRCFTGSKDAVSSSCGSDNRVCATVSRKNGSFTYHCGTKNISRYCEPIGYEGLPQNGCFPAKNQNDSIVSVCCCGANDCNKDSHMTANSTGLKTKLIIGICVAFFIGVLIGGIAVICSKRKNNASARPGDLLTFNYKRMNADELQEEIDLG